MSISSSTALTLPFHSLALVDAPRPCWLPPTSPFLGHQHACPSGRPRSSRSRELSGIISPSFSFYPL
eukprot:921598-Pyramimonas_sp.AAC.1